MKYNKLVAGESVHQEKTLDGLNIGSQGICDYFRSTDTVELLSRGKPMAHQIHSYSEVSIHLIFLSARLSFYRRQADDCCCCCFLLLLLHLAAEEGTRQGKQQCQRKVCLFGWLPNSCWMVACYPFLPSREWKDALLRHSTFTLEWHHIGHFYSAAKKDRQRDKEI